MWSWSFAWHGDDASATAIRTASLRQLSDGRFGEYYEPFTGEAIGSPQQSWTAAAALDWLAHHWVVTKKVVAARTLRPLSIDAVASS